MVLYFIFSFLVFGCESLFAEIFSHKWVCFICDSEFSFDRFDLERLYLYILKATLLLFITSKRTRKMYEK